MTRFAILLLLPGITYCQSTLCKRPNPGAVVNPPLELRSSNGVLRLKFSLRTSVDVYGLRLYCYVYNDNVESPTLRVRPGDEIVLYLKNELPPAQEIEGQAHIHEASATPKHCMSGPMTGSSTNVHFHGLNVPPVCHQDEVIYTSIQPGEAPFEYRIKIPANEPPGLYWYHPHPHGFTERQVLGGASGAIIVEGIEGAAPTVAGLPERVLVLRDQLPEGGAEETTKADVDDLHSSFDVSVNYVPVRFPYYKPAVLLVRPQQREFWRVLNASADTTFDLQVVYWSTPDTQDPQPLQVIALDGVPVGAGYASGGVKSILLPPGSRAEFVTATPPAGMLGQLVSRRYDNGKYGDISFRRVLANMRSSLDAPPAPGAVPESSRAEAPKFAGLASLQAVRQRTFYFSEKFEDPAKPKRTASYYITEIGASPKVFDINFTKPDVTVEQGTVEDWIVENRAEESHVFHIHQLHFQLLERDGKPVTEPALRDTVDLPFWEGNQATKYPSVKLRMDFRNPNIMGTFLYHCHILEHEDRGMMGSIEVVKAKTPKTPPKAKALKR